MHSNYTSLIIYTIALVLIFEGVLGVMHSGFVGVFLVLGFDSIYAIAFLSYFIPVAIIVFSATLLILNKKNAFLYGSILISVFFLFINFYGNVFGVRDSLMCFGDNVVTYFHPLFTVKYMIVILFSTILLYIKQ